MDCFWLNGECDCDLIRDWISEGEGGRHGGVSEWMDKWMNEEWVNEWVREEWVRSVEWVKEWMWGVSKGFSEQVTEWTIKMWVRSEWVWNKWVIEG